MADDKSQDARISFGLMQHHWPVTDHLTSRKLIKVACYINEITYGTMQNLT